MGGRGASSGGRSGRAPRGYRTVGKIRGIPVIRNIIKKSGLPTSLYLIYYGVVRTVLENFRQEEYILRLGNIAVSRLFSILMIAVGVVLFVLVLVKSRKREVKNEKK